MFPAEIYHYTTLRVHGGSKESNHFIGILKRFNVRDHLSEGLGFHRPDPRLRRLQLCASVPQFGSIERQNDHRSLSAKRRLQARHNGRFQMSLG